jgi:DNA-binding response OmpR family regulator
MNDNQIAAAGRSRLLVVDDDAEIRRMLIRLLEAEGYQVNEASNGEELMTALNNGVRPDLILLDVMLSEENGFDLLTAVRRSSDVPVILLTGRGDEMDRVLGLRLGADDYIAKPFSGPELAARVISVLRRYTRTKGPEPILKFGDLTIDTTSREVRMGEEHIEMTLKEFNLLAFLASSPRQVFSREQLLDQVWGSSSAWQDDNTVTEHIRRVRRKIETSGGSGSWIRTVRGVGYSFEP